MKPNPEMAKEYPGAMQPGKPARPFRRFALPLRLLIGVPVKRV